MRRDLAAQDDGTVCVWVCQIRGSRTELGARADKQLAKAWVEQRIDADETEWRGNRGKEIYANNSPDRGIIELVAIHDAVGMIVKDP